MKKIIEKINNTFREEILVLRRARRSGFLFMPDNLTFISLGNIYINEYFRKHELADKVLINLTLQDLVNKKVLVPDPVTITKNRVTETLFYFDVYLRTYDNSVYCRGTATDLATAYGKAVGEVFERTSLKYPSEEIEKIELINKKVREIKNNKDFLDFNILPKATAYQLDKFPNFKIVEEDEFEFVKVKKITGENLFVPRQTIFFGSKNREEKTLLQSTTHGAGAGYTEEQAFASAFFEVLHRHFFLKSWYHKTSPNLLDLSSLDQDSFIRQKIKELENKGFKINILDYRDEAAVPTFICLLEKKGGLYCGGSSSLDLEYAISRSVDEAMSIYYWEVGKIISGENNLDQGKIDNLKDNFLDTSLDGKLRVQVFGNSYFVEKLDKFILRGKKVSLDSYNFNKNNFDIKKYAQDIFGKNIFCYQAKNKYLSEYNFHTVKIYIPNSYYFPLSEIYARPILSDGIEPNYTAVNPFP